MGRDDPSRIFDRILYEHQFFRRKEKDAVRVIGIDSETYQTGEPFMFCTPDRVIRPEEVPEVFFREFPGAKFVVYNISFDSGSFLYHLPPEKLNLIRLLGEAEHEGVHYQYIENKQLRIKNGDTEVILWDVFQYFGTSLNEAAQKYLGEEKMDIETKKFNPEYVAANWDTIVKYCQKDALLTQRLAELVIAGFREMEVPAESLISTAYLSELHFTRRCKPYVLGEDYWRLRDAVRLAFAAYSGGIFQCWRRGRGYFYLYDINSAYPEAIASLVDLRDATWVKEPRYLPNATYAWYLCRVYLDPLRDVYHPLAVRQDGINFYPAGEFEKAMTKVEYEYLTRKGVDVEILDGWHCYAKRENRRPFREEILRLYSLKEELKERGEKGMKYLAVKILMNSFYGKFMQLTPVFPEGFAEKVERGEIPPEDILDDRRRQEFVAYRAGKLWNPFYSSYITALVRVKVLEVAERVKDAAVAVATDSIISTRPLEGDLTLGPGLGEWSKETEGEGIVIGSGVYQIGDLCKFRGFGVKKKFLEYDGDLSAREIVVEEERPYSWKEVLHRGLPKDYINRFHHEPRKLDINFEVRRQWERDWEDVEDMLTSDLMGSMPRLYLELPEAVRAAKWEARQLERQREQEKRNFRRVVMMLGGVRPKGDYESLPRWCRRRNGRTLDDLATEVRAYGYQVQDANDLWEMLWLY